MTKGELFELLKDVPDDTIIIHKGGDMETGHIRETVCYALYDGFHKKVDKQCRDAFDGGQYSIKHWVPCEETDEGATKVIDIY